MMLPKLLAAVGGRRLAVCGLLLPSLLLAQSTFQRRYGGEGWDEGLSVEQTTDGGYIICGYTSSFGAGEQDAWLVKTDSCGDTMWTRTYGGPDHDRGWSVRQTTDGGYLFTGSTSSSGAGHNDVWLVRTDSSGQVIWSRTYGGVGDDVGVSLHPTTDGGYVIGGTTESFGSGMRDFYLVRTDSLGDTLWTRVYGGEYEDIGGYVQQTDDGGYVVTGSRFSRGSGDDVWLIRTDTSGDAVWSRTYGGERDDWADCVEQTDDGGYIMAGTTNSFSAAPRDIYVIRTDTLGDTLWTRTFGTRYEDFGGSVSQTTDGNHFLVASGGSDLWAAKLDDDGNAIWTRTHGGESVDCGLSGQEVSDGGFIMVGHTFSFGAVLRDYYLVKTDPQGNLAVAEPKTPVGQAPVLTTILTRAQLQAELQSDPSLSLFDPSGRLVLSPKPGVLFLRSPSSTRRVVLTR